MKKKDTRNLALLGLLTALVVVLTYFSIPIGPLSITMNVIPVAIAAIALGYKGGAVIGAVFGICSFLQCFGILGVSGMGVMTLGINPVLTFLQRFVPRVLDGLCVGFIFQFVSKISNEKISCFVTGCCTAILNTILFMGSMIILFGNNADFKEKYLPEGVWAYLATIIPNAVSEVIAATIIAGAVGFALFKAKLIEVPEKNLKQRKITDNTTK